MIAMRLGTSLQGMVSTDVFMVDRYFNDAKANFKMREMCKLLYHLMHNDFLKHEAAAAANSPPSAPSASRTNTPT